MVRAHLVSDRDCRLRGWVCVTDQGRWREQPSGCAGWGLALMQATTAHLAIETGAAGTQVTMISHPDVPASVGSRPDAAVLPRTTSR